MRTGMIYNEEDINFLKLTDVQFEEVCFELLLRLSYKRLVWRLGGADSGRDIEGQLATNNPLVGTYDEKWFFECKRYEAGVPAEQLNSKIAWADAEQPKHLVFFISSYLSNNARTWLEKASVHKSYAIHVIEGKQLKQLLLGFPEIVAKYLMDQFTKLLVEARKNWLVHDILPDVETLSLLSADLNPMKLTTSELGFLWCAGKMKACEAGVDEWVSENGPFWLDPFFHYGKCQ